MACTAQGWAAGAVDADVDAVADRIAGYDGVAIAVAGPDRVVVSGREAAVTELLAGDALTGLRTRELETRRAFHSAAMDPAAEAVRAAVHAAPGRPPRLWSSGRGWSSGRPARARCPAS